MDRFNRLVIPSCSGLLDCFNSRITRFSLEGSICCVNGEGDNLFLLSLFSFLYLTKYNLDNCNFSFKVSEFKRYIGYVGGGHSKDIPSLLEDLQDKGYTWSNQTYPNVVKVAFNPSKTVATVESQYILDLIKHMATYNGKINKYGKKIGTGKSTYSSMVYTSILKERNHAAVEIVIELVKAIERRGPLSEGQYLHIKVGTLIQRCPTLYAQVIQANEKKEKNRICKGAINKAVVLVGKHTALYDTFEDLKFSSLEDSQFSLDKKIIIKYKERLMINENLL